MWGFIFCEGIFGFHLVDVLVLICRRSAPAIKVTASSVICRRVCLYALVPSDLSNYLHLNRRMDACLSACLPSTYLPTCLLAYLPTCLRICLLVYLSLIYLSGCFPTYLTVWIAVYLPTCLHYLSACMSSYLPFCLYLDRCLPAYQYLPPYLPTYVPTYLPTHLSTYLSLPAFLLIYLSLSG